MYNVTMKTILVDAVNTFVLPNTGVNKKMFELLELFDNPKIILTNADDEQMETFGLVDLPYEVFTLKHFPEKTDPEYYNIMLSYFNLKPEDTVYFEHNKNAAKNAELAGITTYHYNKEEKDLKALKVFLDTNL